MTDREPSGLIQSVERACRLLRTVAEAQAAPTAAELARAAGLNISTTHHLLNTLISQGMVKKSADRRYLLGQTIQYLASTVRWDVLTLSDVMRELDEVHTKTRETTYVGMWHGDEIVVGAVRPGVVPVVVGGLGLGQRQDSHGATTKAILAFSRRERVIKYFEGFGAAPPVGFEDELSLIRDCRYAMDDGGFAHGVACLSGPVTDSDGLAVGALSVAVPSDRFASKRAGLVEVVRAAAIRASVAVPSNGGQLPATFD